jgi:hypothetical protein
MVSPRESSAHGFHAATRRGQQFSTEGGTINSAPITPDAPDMSPACKELLLNSNVQAAWRSAHVDNYAGDMRGRLGGGAAVLPSGAVHDLPVLGPPRTPRAPNEEFRVVMAEGLLLRDMYPSPELNRLLRAACDVFQVPYAVIAVYSNGRCVPRI